jgi:hypothetical protein
LKNDSVYLSFPSFLLLITQGFDSFNIFKSIRSKSFNNKKDI